MTVDVDLIRKSCLGHPDLQTAGGGKKSARGHVKKKALLLPSFSPRA